MTSSVMPLVSIIVPVYNHEQFVDATIKSLIGQTYQNLELIVVDDGSSDGSVEILGALAQDCKSRFVRFLLVEQPHAGTAAALNRGIAASDGCFLFWLASDDLAEPATVATLLPELIGDPDVGLACGDANFVDEQARPVSRQRDGKDFTSFVRFFSARKKDFNLDTDFGSYRSVIGDYYIPIGCLIRRSHFLEAGYFDTSYINEDIELWLRLSKICRFRFVDRTLCHYRLHTTNIHRTQIERLTFDGLRLRLREARYCMNNGLADEWQQIVEEKLVENAAVVGEYFQERLAEIPSRHVKEVRGRGLLIGLELKPEAGGARRFCEALLERGILCKETHENALRFAPPLTIDRATIDGALGPIAEVLNLA